MRPRWRHSTGSVFPKGSSPCPWFRRSGWADCVVWWSVSLTMCSHTPQCMYLGSPGAHRYIHGDSIKNTHTAMPCLGYHAVKPAKKQCTSNTFAHGTTPRSYCTLIMQMQACCAVYSTNRRVLCVCLYRRFSTETWLRRAAHLCMYRTTAQPRKKKQTRYRSVHEKH